MAFSAVISDIFIRQHNASWPDIPTSHFEFPQAAGPQSCPGTGPSPALKCVRCPAEIFAAAHQGTCAWLSLQYK